MKISVIIPSFDQQEYLPDAIESVLTQKVKPFEVIVVDDGSTDSSLEIARKYPVTVVSQRNKGLASARNTGIMNATGDYVFPLDADDIMLENCIDLIGQAIFQTGCDIIAPSFKQFGVSNQTVILTGTPTTADFTTANRLPYFSAIRRSALLECGGYSPRMDKGYEDWHMWHDLFSRGKSLCLIQTPLVLYRTKASSMYTEALKYDAQLKAQIRKDFPSIYA